MASSPDWLVTVDEARSPYTVRLDQTSLALPNRVPFAPPGSPQTNRRVDIPTLAELPPGTLPDPKRRQLPR